ncbi:MAG TPA: S8 family serine peptidase, partial [Actinomycetota bacterium]|nr:S8 family serine peptidase [Actinomycetota bacterium]
MRRYGMLALAVTLALTATGATAGQQARRNGVVEAGLLQETGAIAVVARFARSAPARFPDGFEVRYRFVSVPAVYGLASPAALRALSRMEGLAHLGRDKGITFDLDTATVASRARDVWAPADPNEPVRVDGSTVDGAGIGIAIVDTGLDGTHPDFQVAGKVRGNYLVHPQGVVETPYSNGGHPHGTHVAGIAAGNGFASGGTFRGAAPGAALYAFGMGAASIAIPSIAFDWILQHGAQQDPPIRVVNNSWHCTKQQQCRTFNPDDIHIVLATRLVESGVTITWSAGNDGGDGFLANTNIESRNPTPGIISVANYDDDERGLRTRCVTGTSSRGAATAPETWPDVAAPGRTISSTWAFGPSTSPPHDTTVTRTPDGRNTYRQLTGTSMAAPHVAGIVALMLQARPTLSPAEIEYLIKSTATKLACTMRGRLPNPAAADAIDREPAEHPRADPSHPYDGANFIEGHGLVDARAAVEAAVAFAGIPSAPDTEPLPDAYQRIRIGMSTDRTLYVRGTGLSDAVPEQRVGAQAALSDTALSFTSDGSDGFAAGGVHVEAWIGTTAEYELTFLGRRTTVHADWAGLKIGVEKLSGTGSTVLVDAKKELRLVPAAAPVYRRWTFALETPVVFEVGDRVR